MGTVEQISAREDVDREIEAGAPIPVLRRHFASQREALDYYRAYWLRQREGKLSTGECVECGGKNNVRIIGCVWQGTYHPLYLTPAFLMMILLKVHSFTSRYTWTFETLHLLCGQCRSRFYRGRAVAVALQVTGLFLLGVGLLAAFLWLAFPALYEIGNIRDTATIRAYGLGGCAAAIGGAGMLILRRKIPLPRSMSHVKRRPFELSLAVPVTRV
jgi:hypothetical protein